MIIRKLVNNKINNLIEYSLLFVLIVFAFIMPISADLGRKVLTVAFIILIPILDYKKIYTIIKNNTYIKYITIFILFCILSMLWTEDYDEGKRIIRTILRYWYIPTIVLISIINKENIKYVIAAFLSGMIINHLISYAIYFFKIKTIFSFQLVGTELNPVVFQASHMEYSVYLAFTSLILFYYSLKYEYYKFKIPLFVLSLSMITVLFLLFGRTGQVSFIITSTILILIYFKKNIKLIILSFLGLIGIFYIAYNNGITFKDRVNQAIIELKQVTNSTYNTSIGVRLSAYRIIPEIIDSTNIFIGVGIGDSRNITYEINKKLYDNAFDVQKGKLHESFLTIFHALGIVGLFLFTYSLYYLCRLKGKDKDVNFIKYAFIPLIIVSIMTNEFMGQKEILLLLALFPSIFISDDINDDYNINKV